MSIDLRTMKGRAPSRIYTCPDCAAKFKSATTTKNDRRGKTCPNGHWHAIHHLEHFERTGRLPIERTNTGKPKGDKTDNLKKVRINARRRLCSLGIENREEQLTIALSCMLTGLDQALAALPKTSLAHSIVAGAFGKTPQISREVLGR